jgi:hypothetical protein
VRSLSGFGGLAALDDDRPVCAARDLEEPPLMARPVLPVRAPGGPSSTDGARIAPEEQETTEHDLQGRRLHDTPSPKMSSAATSSSICRVSRSSIMQRVEP